MAERELRLRRRIDVLMAQRDRARAERDRALRRVVQVETLARRLAQRLAGVEPEDVTELRRRVTRLTETRSRVRRSRNMWRDRALAAEWALRQRNRRPAREAA